MCSPWFIIFPSFLVFCIINQFSVYLLTYLFFRLTTMILITVGEYYLIIYDLNKWWLILKRKKPCWCKVDKVQISYLSSHLDNPYSKQSAVIQLLRCYMLFCEVYLLPIVVVQEVQFSGKRIYFLSSFQISSKCVFLKVYFIGGCVTFVLFCLFFYSST